MNKWLRRVLYLVFIAFWLAVMFFPTFAFVLIINDQIEIGGTRVFLLNTEDASGIGIQRASEARTEDDVACQRGSIFYLMWRGTGNNEANRYCSCADGTERVPDGRWCRLE